MGGAFGEGGGGGGGGSRGVGWEAQVSSLACTAGMSVFRVASLRIAEPRSSDGCEVHKTWRDTWGKWRVTYGENGHVRLACEVAVTCT